MTHSSSQTSITGLRDWYTHKPQTIFQTYCPSVQGNLLLQSLCVPGLFSRSPSCCMLEGQGSTCTSCATFSAVLLGWESGLHTSFRLVRNTRLSFIILSRRLLYIQRSRVLLYYLTQIQVWGNTSGVQQFMQALAILMSPAR